VVSLEDIKAASGAVYTAAFVTPCLHSQALSDAFAAPVYLKAECLQNTGSFKVRGAAARIALLSPAEQARGVVTASAGNHAQGVAVAARANGVKATVVMPVNAALAKVQATRAYGADVVLHGQSFDEAQARRLRLRRAGQGDGGVRRRGGHRRAGQCRLEIATQCPEAELVLVPVGAAADRGRRRH
jgi:threonine dehydratase